MIRSLLLAISVDSSRIIKVVIKQHHNTDYQRNAHNNAECIPNIILFDALFTTIKGGNLPLLTVDNLVNHLYRNHTMMGRWLFAHCSRLNFRYHLQKLKQCCFRLGYVEQIFKVKHLVHGHFLFFPLYNKKTSARINKANYIILWSRLLFDKRVYYTTESTLRSCSSKWTQLFIIAFW